MKVTDFDYFLPEELIAQEPAHQRDESRLLVLSLADNNIEHRHFKDLTEYLRPGDTLVLNDTRVIPARLMGRKEETGAEIEVLLLTPLGGRRWETLVRPGKKARVGTKIIFSDGLLTGLVVDYTDVGGRVVEFEFDGDFETILHELGRLPLPPYIKKVPEDPLRYQTVYARQAGSAAAPTAGLHFTPQLLDKIRASGVKLVSVLLHVGLGTFRPVQAENIEEHHMHEEYYEVSPETAEIINSTRARGGRVIAVGTTTTRCLETASDVDGRVKAGSGRTDIFIYPGYRFKIIDGLVTNFHLPKSTLIMMVSALAGKEKVLDAYRVAVEERYRFFSFGDAMLII